MESSITNITAYLESWGNELAARQNRVRNLIGDAHWLSDGHHKEAILRDFLVRYLPQETECATGFIRGASADRRCSREVDILLFSRRLHIPYFSEGGISIVDPSSVLATIEVKSGFATSPLVEAIENIKIAREILGKDLMANVWSGLFFYDIPESRTLDSTLKTLGESLRKVYAAGNGEGLIPTCVVLGQNCIAFPAAQGEKIRIRAFQGVSSAFSSAICDLLGSISSRISGHGLSGFEAWGTAGSFELLEATF